MVTRVNCATCAVVVPPHQSHAASPLLNLRQRVTHTLTQERGRALEQTLVCVFGFVAVCSSCHHVNGQGTGRADETTHICRYVERLYDIVSFHDATRTHAISLLARVSLFFTPNHCARLHTHTQCTTCEALVLLLSNLRPPARGGTPAVVDPAMGGDQATCLLALWLQSWAACCASLQTLRY